MVDKANKEGKVNFRVLLLTQCQREFEKDKKGNLNREARLVEIATEMDQLEKDKLRLLGHAPLVLERRRNELDSDRWRGGGGGGGQRGSQAELRTGRGRVPRNDQQTATAAWVQAHFGDPGGLSVDQANKEDKVNRVLLLTQCQREFEEDKKGNLNREARLAEIATELDEQVKKEKMRSPPQIWLAPSGGRGRGRGRDGVPPPAAPAAPTGPVLKGQPTMDADKMSGKVGMICEEFVDSKDFASSVLDVEEVLHADTMAQFVAECMNKYVDARSTEPRHMVGDLHGRLLVSGHLTTAAYLRGLDDMLAVAVDLAADIPGLWANLAEMLAPVLLAERGVTVAALVEPAKPVIADRCGPQFVVALLKRLVSLHGDGRVCALVTTSEGCTQDWSVFFGSEDHVPLFVKAQLGFLVTGVKVPLAVKDTPPGKGVRFLVSKIRKEPDIGSWIKINVKKQIRASVPFVRDIVRALCFDCIVRDEGAKIAVLRRLGRHFALLQCLVATVELELAALDAVVTLVCHLQFPPGVLDELFCHLYDMHVVSEQTFMRWRESVSPFEQELRDVVLKSLESFYQALEERTRLLATMRTARDAGARSLA